MTENQFSTKAMQWFVRKSALEIGSITFTMIRKHVIRPCGGYTCTYFIF